MIGIEHLVAKPKVILLPDKVVDPLVMEQLTLSHESNSIKLIKTSVGSGMNKNIILSRARQTILLGDARQFIEIVRAIITNSIATLINTKTKEDVEIQTRNRMKTSNKLGLKNSFEKCKRISREWKKKLDANTNMRRSTESSTGSSMVNHTTIHSILLLKTGTLNKK